MSRPLRIQAAGLTYHVMARGNNKMTICVDSLDYARFLQILRHVIVRFDIDSWIVCAMPNHYHLVFRTRQPNLSLAVRHLNAEYARWWNRRHGHVGHVFQARFKAQIVETGLYLLRVCRYVLLNPVRAHLVSHPGAWKWSSYPYLATDAATDLVDTSSLLAALDPDQRSDTRARLLDFVEAAADGEIATFIRRDRRLIGSSAFAAQFRRHAAAASDEIPARDHSIATPSILTLLTAAIEGGRTIADGVVLAHAAGYAAGSIANVSGLSRRSVQRILARESPNPRVVRALL